MTTCAFKMLLIFSDRSACELTNQAAARLAQEFEDGDCSQTSWKTELLRSPKLRLLAAREAADADLVIIALREGSELPPEVAEWLELWRTRRRRRRSTLVVLTRRANHTTTPLAEEALHAFAANAGMDFFCHSRVGPRASRGTYLEVLL